MKRVGNEPWRAHLAKHAAAAARTFAPEAIHQVRVAIGHLRVWLRVGQHIDLAEDLRSVRDSLAAVRDLDVRLGQDPPPSVAAALERQRKGQRKTVVAALRGKRLSRILDELTELPPIRKTRIERATVGLKRRVRRRGKRAAQHKYDIDRLHRLRCALRRLRLAREWVDAPTHDLERVQDALGRACDCHVALEGLDNDRPAPGGHRYKKRLLKERDRAVRKAWRAWRRLLRDEP